MKSPIALLKSPCCLYVMGGVVLLFAILAVLVGSFVIFWTTESQPLPTVNGPEQPALLNSLNATLVSVHGSDELQVLSVPSLTSRSFQAQDRVWAVSGPDSAGRAVYSVGQSAVVKLMQIDITNGKRSEITSHRGTEPFWEQSAFSSLALSPTSGRLAFRRRIPSDRSDAGPFDGVDVIEVWSLDGERLALHEAPNGAYDLAWQPHTSVLAFAEFVAVADLPPELQTPDSHPEKVHVVNFLDTESGAKHAILAGSHPLFSPDGKFLCVDTGDDQLVVLDLEEGTRREVNAPGYLYPTALAASNLFIYQGLTTTGEEQESLWTLTTTAQWKWTLKLVNLDSGEFVTLHPHIHRFHRFSLGAGD